MSSNIKIIRICEYCGKEFTARTTVTKYCSSQCSKRAYKERKRAEKIEKSNKETRKIKNLTNDELKTKEFLTVTEVSKLIGCSRQNVYKLIKTGKLKATNLLIKKTIIKRSDLDKLFEKPQPVYVIKKPLQIEVDIKDCYTMTEIQEKYGISEKALQAIINKNNIPKLKYGWYSYVPKTLINKILS